MAIARTLRAWRPLLLALAATACVIALTAREQTRPLDDWLYDRLVSALPAPVDDRIVLVVVDDKSLSALGRWPWSRGIHAQLLRQLQPATPKAIGFDILLSEVDRSDPGGDAALAAAMHNSGHVVSPVAAEASQPEGPLIEVLPMSTLVKASAALGHVGIDTDPDGVAREAWLHAGLGSAHWPTLALAMRNLDPAQRDTTGLPGMRAPVDTPRSAYLWTRDHRVRVPYARPGGFQQVSYVDVLRGQVPTGLFADRLILVGVTATGLAREVRIPGPSHDRAVPGVEYHAHVLNALLGHSLVTPMPRWQQFGLGIVLVLLPLLPQARRIAGRPWVAVAIAAAASLITCAALFQFAHVWFMPMPALLVLAGGFALWLLARWRRSQRLASSDRVTGLANRHLFDLTLERELGSARRSGKPLSLLLVDVDHFKPYNDHYGHQAGDTILAQVARTLMAHGRRPRDLAARYGGDELALILPESPATAASGIAGVIVADVRAQQLPHAHSPTAAGVTLSIGVATFDPHAPDAASIRAADLLRRADAALYQAKHDGRDRAAMTPD